MRQFHYQVEWRLDDTSPVEVIGQTTLRRYADAILNTALAHVGEARIVCSLGFGKTTK